MSPNFHTDLLRALCTAPVLLHPRYSSALTSMLFAHHIGRPDRAAQHRTELPTEQKAKPWDAREAVQITPGGTAIIPMKGMVYAGVDPVTAWYWDLCRPEAIQAAVAAVRADPKVKAVVFDCDSPGGLVSQVPETAADIAELNREKLTVTFVGGLDCSAAYWMTSQTRHIAATLTSDNGCVGTYATYYDMSGYYEKLGIKQEFFGAGKYKGLGVRPFNDEDRAFLQSDIDRTNARFLAAVQSARPQIERPDLEGQWFDGEQSVEKGLTDSLVRNLAEVIRQIESPVFS